MGWAHVLVSFTQQNSFYSSSAGSCTLVGGYGSVAGRCARIARAAGCWSTEGDLLDVYA